MITNIAFKKDTPVEKFVSYVCGDDELYEKFINGETISFAYSKYMFFLSLDNNEDVLQIHKFGSDWSDMKRCNVEDMFESTENKYLKLASADPEKALLEIADEFRVAAGIAEKDKNSADIKLCIEWFVKSYDMLLFSKMHCDALPSAKDMINQISDDFKHIEYMVNLILKIMDAIDKNKLSNKGKTLYELIINEFVKKVDQQT